MKKLSIALLLFTILCAAAFAQNSPAAAAGMVRINGGTFTMGSPATAAIRTPGASILASGSSARESGDREKV